MGTAAAGRPDTGGRRRARLRGRLAPAQLRGCPGGEKQPLLQPAPPRALLRQRLRRTREEGWARENEGTTSHSEASGRCQPPSSAALTGRRGTESGGRRARGNTWWRRRGGESALCDVIAKEAGLFVRAEPRRLSRTSKEVQDAPCRSLKNLQLLSDPGKNVAKAGFCKQRPPTVPLSSQVASEPGTWDLHTFSESRKKNFKRLVLFMPSSGERCSV
ncbi:uncharacterized protein [Odocoileus virginianus]|uniref:Uncharacterized protein n=1 Tax=Odocoileus virginianus TaxID=9874 RepID=A0ABM4HA34_ODOVR